MIGAILVWFGAAYGLWGFGQTVGWLFAGGESFFEKIWEISAYDRVGYFTRFRVYGALLCLTVIFWPFILWRLNHPDDPEEIG